MNKTETELTYMDGNALLELKKECLKNNPNAKEVYKKLQEIVLMK
ncbi:hypothetical protein [Aneurinibacillus migulanus]|uniref:Uncharacterized protein n=1 Tax=Aneurinibacillus migulanus TaxID=47500 RepID=A0A1G8WML6_ANEMI|nr:hypothetical protein [Aneurinibacillus migulanus]MED0894957.1 hypothetical protein [Aneurinibacillus migulanus]MED1614400.1 hypothetical protein [Aneurinibacillus migulanus]GED14812.1 hypothetical protein AMI01nite_28030 [Aneurinibacillus migulanus]SDJ78885.1 hypothetical protein SAMN04487909_12888 [Aneurinibacillus migulanus]